MTPLPPHRARSAWTRCQRGTVALDAIRAPIRPSLARFYPAREDPTRTRSARRESRALRLARSLKYNPNPLGGSTP